MSHRIAECFTSSHSLPHHLALAGVRLLGQLYCLRKAALLLNVDGKGHQNAGCRSLRKLQRIAVGSRICWKEELIPHPFPEQKWLLSCIVPTAIQADLIVKTTTKHFILTRTYCRLALKCSHAGWGRYSWGKGHLLSLWEQMAGRDRRALLLKGAVVPFFFQKWTNRWDELKRNRLADDEERQNRRLSRGKFRHSLTWKHSSSSSGEKNVISLHTEGPR